MVVVVIRGWVRDDIESVDEQLYGDWRDTGSYASDGGIWAWCLSVSSSQCGRGSDDRAKTAPRHLG
jgi:hypothetical protein